MVKTISDEPMTSGHGKIVYVNGEFPRSKDAADDHWLPDKSISYILYVYSPLAMENALNPPPLPSCLTDIVFDGPLKAIRTSDGLETTLFFPIGRFHVSGMTLVQYIYTVQYMLWLYISIRMCSKCRSKCKTWL